MRLDDVIDLLALRFGYQSILQISGVAEGADDGTGEKPAMPAKSGSFENVEQIEYIAEADSSEATPDAFVDLVLSKRRFDIVVVQTLQSRQLADRDLLFALNLLSPRGTMVVPQIGAGELFEAYVDFTIARKGISHVAIDMDQPVGLMARNYRFNTFYAGPATPLAEIDWFVHRENPDPKLSDDDRHALLRMIPLARFTALMDDFEVFSS